MERREFLKYSTLVSTGLWAEGILVRTVKGRQGTGKGGRSLVIVELVGGCDGLNTVIPYTDDAYYALRPNLAISAAKVLKVTDSLGFHPSLTGFRALYEEGKVAVIQGVGYPEPSRSHVRSQEIWHTGKVEEVGEEGWIARYFERSLLSLKGVSLGEEVPRAMRMGRGSPGCRKVGVCSDLLAEKGGYKSCVRYPDTVFSSKLRTVAQMIAAESKVKVFYTDLPGFDTHLDQVVAGESAEGRHAVLLETLSSGVRCFFDDLKAMGKEKDVLLMVFSEFGRRARENATLGTDHGTANLMFLVGAAVRPGFYGEYPGLGESQVDRLGDMVYRMDFRSVYSTILAKWLKANPVAVLGDSWPQVSFV